MSPTDPLIFLVFCVVVFVGGSVVIIFLVFCAVVFGGGSVVLIFLAFCVVVFGGARGATKYYNTEN
jgi:hypothetical protein